jgi:ParB-like chromosome segregation protein Spo0J
MDLAMLIGGLRRDGLTGSAGTKRIASYLGVSISTVTQAERLLSVEKELQHKVHSGELSMQSTYDLLREIGSPGERTAVLQRAREIQEENRTDDALDAYLGGHRSQEWATQALAPKSRIEHPSITAAIEEHRGSRNGFHCAHKPSRTDLLNEFEAYRHPPYRPEVCAFIDYLIGEYAAGKGTSRDFKAKFESMIRQ